MNNLNVVEAPIATPTFAQELATADWPLWMFRTCLHPTRYLRGKINIPSFSNLTYTFFTSAFKCPSGIFTL